MVSAAICLTCWIYCCSALKMWELHSFCGQSYPTHTHTHTWTHTHLHYSQATVPVKNKSFDSHISPSYVCVSCCEGCERFVTRSNRTSVWKIFILTAIIFTCFHHSATFYHQCKCLLAVAVVLIVCNTPKMCCHNTLNGSDVCFSSHSIKFEWSQTNFRHR